MSDDPKQQSDEAFLVVPGLLCVSAAPSGQRIVRLGPAAGWMIPAGIMRWERELSFMVRTDMTAELARALHATLPSEQIAAARFPLASRAAEASPLLALGGNLVEAVRQRGARVHTVGVDRVSGGFYYFAEGGSGAPVNVQGSLIDMVAPSLTASSTNADINELLEGLIDRLLATLSEGVVSELEVELADALPRLSKDGTGLDGTDLEAFDAQARALAGRAARHEEAGRRLADALAAAARDKLPSARVPLYGEARRQRKAPLEVSIGGQPLQLPEQLLWTVVGPPRETVSDRAVRVPGLTQPASEPRSKAAPQPGPERHPAAQPRSSAAEPQPAAKAQSATESRTAGQVRTKGEPPAASPEPTPPRAPEARAESSVVAAGGAPAIGEKASIAREPPATPASRGVDVAPSSPSSPAAGLSAAVRSGGPRAAKTPAHVAVFLLAAFVVTLYLFCRTLFGYR
jgi:hypothetical protein